MFILFKSGPRPHYILQRLELYSLYPRFVFELKDLVHYVEVYSFSNYKLCYWAHSSGESPKKSQKFDENSHNACLQLKFAANMILGGENRESQLKPWHTS